MNMMQTFIISHHNQMQTTKLIPLIPNVDFQRTQIENDFIKQLPPIRRYKNFNMVTNANNLKVQQTFSNKSGFYIDIPCNYIPNVKPHHFPLPEMPFVSSSQQNDNMHSKSGNTFTINSVAINNSTNNPILRQGNYPIVNTNINTSYNTEMDLDSKKDIHDNAENDEVEKKDYKERNRIAAQKWRKKKDAYLMNLENENDQLRQEALKLCNQTNSLKIENSFLEKELQFFQMFIATVMKTPKE
ncbi:hypothetical protein TRFO_18003 [Tritrichomonas foetus]|uniref:BZIP domain-containing protein n=1 Tax=Tritrichomonas foetus TaxID=1144522 RepID=A0A1J4KMC9_9EUKA|nr:hypothetical protein TRFO_18003 [Tritrichomonas foetus]|eukprot:OHT12298.1 hypothetical protein TRFO_18003 [Tritrichomonas foetus]